MSDNNYIPVTQSQGNNTQINNNIQNTKQISPDNYSEFSFHKKKQNLDFFNPGPDVEEIPTFSYENDKNLSSYQRYMNSKSALIDEYQKNYIDYMKKFRNPRRNSPSSNVYSVFKEKMASVKNLSDLDVLGGEGKNPLNSTPTNATLLHNSNSNKIPFSEYENQNISKSLNLGPQNNIYNMREVSYIGRKNEITNPDRFYKQYNRDYFNYINEQKNYMDYNYQMMIKKMERGRRKFQDDINVNPYNAGSDSCGLGNTILKHNTILNPSPYYGINKYLKNSKNMNEKDGESGHNYNLDIDVGNTSALARAGKNYIKQ